MQEREMAALFGGHETPGRKREQIRLALVRRIQAPDGRSSPTFDRILSFARRLFGVDSVVISIVDESTVWVKAALGPSNGVQPRHQSFCHYTILGNEVFTVVDALKDERFKTSPAVCEGARHRFYAGAPVVLGPEIRVGTLALLHSAPRQLSRTEQQDLKDLASWVATELRLSIVFKALLRKSFG